MACPRIVLKLQLENYFRPSVGRTGYRNYKTNFGTTFLTVLIPSATRHCCHLHLFYHADIVFCHKVA